MPRKKSGKLCCGGVVSVLAYHYRISAESRVPYLGSRAIDRLGYLGSGKASMVTVDSRGVACFILDKKKLFRFPASQLTTVEGWANQAKWKLNLPDHLVWIANDPP